MKIQTSPVESPLLPSRRTSRFTLSTDTGLIAALWLRDMLRFKKEKSRWMGLIAQPLLFWVFIGLGIQKSLQFPNLQNVGYLEFFFPGTLVMCILFTSIFASMSLIEDKQTGFVRLALVAPGSTLSLVTGKVLGTTTVALLQSLFFVAFAPLAGFGYTEIHWGKLLAILLMGCMSLSAFNFAIAWKLNSTGAYHAIMSVFLLPLWIISGTMFPISQPALKTLLYFNPMAFLAEGTRHAFGGDTRALAAFSYETSALMLALFMVASFLFAIFTVYNSKDKGAAQ